MGFDTKYRPKTYSDVLGQSTTISILKELVKQKRGFRQSYCFQGPFGTGKTTLARIFSKALLCDEPREGSPCNRCSSCKILQEGRPHPDIIEVDAASNSRKEDVEKIIESIKYNSFSGKQKVYIFDEAHGLSRYAQDLLLLPLENNIPGSEDKTLVCIFCTTEPAKMRASILSRCAPSFEITQSSMEEVVSRLTFICQEEGLEYEGDALRLIAELKEGHVRDCLKALETLSSLGKITKEKVEGFFHLNYNEELLNILLSLREEDISDLPQKVEMLGEKLSPSFMYEKMTQWTMLAFKAKEGIPIPSFLNSEKIKELHEIGAPLLRWVRVLSSRPYNVSIYTLICDLILCQDVLKGRHQEGNNYIISTQKKDSDGSMKKAGISKVGVFVSPEARNVDKDFIKPSSEDEIKEEEFSSSLENVLKGLKNG